MFPSWPAASAPPPSSSTAGDSSPSRSFARCPASATRPSAPPSPRHEDTVPLSPDALPAQARREDPSVQHDPAPVAISRGDRGHAGAHGAGVGRCAGAPPVLPRSPRRESVLARQLGAIRTLRAHGTAGHLRLLSLGGPCPKRPAPPGHARVRRHPRPLLLHGPLPGDPSWLPEGDGLRRRGFGEMDGVFEDGLVPLLVGL